jgi:uncharacterized protein (DUF427 family)
MMEDTLKRHYAAIDAYPRKLTLKYNNEIIAESQNALILKEVAKSVYNPVFYFPKEDIKADLVNETERKSYCPIKGDASYWNFKENPTSDYLAWSYENALPRTKKIEGYIAFNLDQITLISEPM